MGQSCRIPLLRLQKTLTSVSKHLWTYWLLHQTIPILRTSGDFRDYWDWDSDPFDTVAIWYRSQCLLPPKSDSNPRWSLNPCCRSKHECWKHGLHYTYLAGQDHSGQVLHAASGGEPIAFACHWLWTFSMHFVLQQLPRGPHAFLSAFGALLAAFRAWLAAFLLSLLFSHSFSWSSSWRAGRGQSQRPWGTQLCWKNRNAPYTYCTWTIPHKVANQKDLTFSWRYWNPCHDSHPKYGYFEIHCRWNGIWDQYLYFIFVC